MCTRKETILLPQGCRNPRGSACGGGIVPASPTSRAHCEPESSDGLPGLLPASSPGEEAFAEVWRLVTDGLCRLLTALGPLRGGGALPSEAAPSRMESSGCTSGPCCCRSRTGSGGVPPPKPGSGPVGPSLDDLMGRINTIGRTLDTLCSRVSSLERKGGGPPQKSWAEVARGGKMGGRPPTGVTGIKGPSSRDTGGRAQNKGSTTEAVDRARCYNCRARGHLRVRCPVPGGTDRCYRCAGAGHLAAACRGKPFCRACEVGGLDHHHIAGGLSCRPWPPRSPGKSSGGRKAGGTGRGAPGKSREPRREAGASPAAAPLSGPGPRSSGKESLEAAGRVKDGKPEGRGGVEPVATSAPPPDEEVDVGVEEKPRPPPRKNLLPQVRCSRCRAWGHELEDCVMVREGLSIVCNTCSRLPKDHDVSRCALDPFCMVCYRRGERGHEVGDLRHVAGDLQGGCRPWPPRWGWPTVLSPDASEDSEDEGDALGAAEEAAPGAAPEEGCSRTRGVPLHFGGVWRDEGSPSPPEEPVIAAGSGPVGAPLEPAAGLAQERPAPSSKKAQRKKRHKGEEG